MTHSSHTQHLTPEMLAELKQRILSEPGFANGLLAKAGITSPDGKLTAQYGGDDPQAEQAGAQPKKALDDPRLQELFWSAISGAMAFGAQGMNKPPEGHWLTRAWETGRDSARPVAQEPGLREALEWIVSLRTGGQIEGRARAALGAAGAPHQENGPGATMQPGPEAASENGAALPAREVSREAEAGTDVATGQAAAGTAGEGVAFDICAHLHRQAEFSARTFGPGDRTDGVCDHIRKELAEVQADAALGLDTLPEWVDVIILAFDGAWRSGATPQQIVDAIVAKQAKNEGRNWPDWRTVPANKAIEHDRSGEGGSP